MKKFIAATALAFALGAGVASADTLDNAYGNTVVVTYASGATAQYHFNADGTFTGVAPGGSQMAGRWEVQGEQLCLIPPSGQAPTCTHLEAGKSVGDTWTQTAADGSQISVTIREGR